MVKSSKAQKGTRPVTLKDADADKFVKQYAAYLKKQGKIHVPKWTDIAKTGIQCELAPNDPDWFYTRVASVARQVYFRPGSGIGGLKKRYGSSYQKNCIRPHFQKAAGSPIRKALQALEDLGILEKRPNGGRQITDKGAQDMDRIAGAVVMGN
eukprot:TRINITY_DN955_c0_g2_i1.p1 TRINITY_DN955_c0_g2~~TRINITY_DN955_c0_g2_i1.p1  ORF type:complete len:173 (+),score=51.57 TRINITY_DN955_c0_g2_i1:63-521(+)